MAVDAELQDAINHAAEEITGKPISEIGKPEVATAAAAETEEATEVETEIDQSELSEEEVAEAKRLYTLLKDPTNAVAITAALAQKHGLLVDRPLETKAEVKEAKKDILSIFEEALGPQYKFLAPNLSKALNEVLAQERETQQAAISEVQQTQILGEVDKTLAAIAKETNGQSRQLENKMADLMKEYPIGDKGNIDKYIRDIYTLASAGRKTTIVKQQVSEKIRRNANDVSDRISTNRGTFPVEALPGKKLGLKGSVEFALKQLEARNK